VRGVNQFATMLRVGPRGSGPAGGDCHGRGSAFNDNGQIAFSVQFTDGTHATYRAQAPLSRPADFKGNGG